MYDRCVWSALILSLMDAGGALRLEAALYAPAAVVSGVVLVLRCVWARRLRQAGEALAAGRARDEALMLADAAARDEEAEIAAEARRNFSQQELVSPLDRARILTLAQNLFLALTLRLVWLLLEIHEVMPVSSESDVPCKDPRTVVAAVNRLAQLLFFTAFVSVAAFWAKVLRGYEDVATLRRRTGAATERGISEALAQSTTRRRAGFAANVALSDVFEGFAAGARTEIEDEQGFDAICSLLCIVLTPDLVQTLLNFWAYVIVGVLIVVQWFECDQRRYDKIDHVQTITIACFFCILSGMYLLYGARLVAAIKSTRHPLKNRFMGPIILLTMIGSIAFFLRGVVFLLHPVFGITLTGQLAKVAYPWFFYPVPELLPTVFILYFLIPRPKPIVSRFASIHTPLLSQAENGTRTFSGATGAISSFSSGAEEQQPKQHNFGSFLTSHEQVFWV